MFSLETLSDCVSRHGEGDITKEGVEYAQSLYPEVSDYLLLAEMVVNAGHVVHKVYVDAGYETPDGDESWDSYVFDNSSMAAEFLKKRKPDFWEATFANSEDASSEVAKIIKNH